MEQKARLLLKKYDFKFISPTKSEIIVHPHDIPGEHINGQFVEYNGKSYQIIDENYIDFFGPCILLDGVDDSNT